MNPKKPYRCSKCKQVGHQSRSCHASPAAYASLEGAEALRALVPEAYGVWIVIAEQGQTGLVGALKAEAERTSRGFSPSRSHSNAYQWLCERAAELPPEALRRAKRASAALEQAQRAYAEATLPIRIALGYAEPGTVLASESRSDDSDADPGEPEEPSTSA